MKKVLASLTLLLTVWAAGAQEHTSMNNRQADGYRGIWFTIGQARSAYGAKYSGGLGTYTMTHIPMAVYAPQADKTFFVYGGTPSEDRKYLLCMAGCYDHKTGMLRRPVVVFDKGVDGVCDPHDDPTIQIDRDGYVWVFVAGRANKRPGIRYRSTKPYDISEFEYVNESIMAYPQVHYHPEKGFFLFFTRYDGVRQLFCQTSPDGREWSGYRQIASIIDEGETKSGHYQFTNLCGDKLMCCFNRHINGDVDTRTNIYYIQSEDWGRTWTTIDGKPVELPITRSKNPALVHDYRAEQRNCYIKDINFGTDGQPVILYLTSDNHLTGPDGGIRRWHTVRWNGSKWVYSEITTSTHCYDSGSLWIDRNDVWTVIAPTDAGPQYWGTGGEMVMWRSRDKGLTWERVRTLTHDSPRNHGYARRPLNADKKFYAFWADGNPDSLSISYLYFCNDKGDVFRMPYSMNAQWQKPEPVPGGKPRNLTLLQTRHSACTSDLSPPCCSGQRSSAPRRRPKPGNATGRSPTAWRNGRSTTSAITSRKASRAATNTGPTAPSTAAWSSGAKRRATSPARSSCSPSAAATTGAWDGGSTMPTTSASDRLT